MGNCWSTAPPHLEEDSRSDPREPLLTNDMVVNDSDGEEDLPQLVRRQARPTLPLPHAYRSKKGAGRVALPDAWVLAEEHQREEKKRKVSERKKEAVERDMRMAHLRDHSARRIQSVVRQRHAKRVDATVILQSRWRGFAARRDFRIRQRRERVGQELIDTEQSFVGYCTSVQRLFLTPLREDLRSPKPLMNKEDVRVVFGPMETILNVNEQLLAGLIEARKQDVPDYGSVFLQYLRWMKVFEVYVSDYPRAIATLNRCQQSNEALAAFLFTQSKVPECNKLHLSEMLPMPVQRVPRYVLLLTELDKFMPPNRPETATLHKALTQVRELADSVNEKRRQAEQLARMVDVNSKLEWPQLKRLKQFQKLIQPHRRMVFDGEVVEMVRSGEEHVAKKFHWFLFNDLLLRTKPRGKSYKVKGAEYLVGCEVEGDGDDGIVVQTPQAILQVRFNQGDQAKWMAVLKQHIDEQVSASAAHLGVVIGEVQPKGRMGRVKGSRKSAHVSSGVMDVMYQEEEEDDDEDDD